MGGMAQVLPCKDTVLERRAAIKVMPGSANKRRILDELRALLKMRSKHVVQVYDILKIGNDLGIVQEFVEGTDLLDPSSAPGTLEQYLKLMWQLATGIADIHRVQVIHRDIKPNNMKVDPESVLKIFDFGLARDEGGAASTEGFIGTPGYAAPELFDPKPKFTAAVDTYAFGATALYVARRSLPPELLARPPRPGNASYFSGLAIALPSEVAVLLDRCLDTNAADRPKMSEVAAILAMYLVQNRHRALVVFRGSATFLDATRPSVSLSLGNVGAIEIRYDGLTFRAAKVEGEVFINANPIAVGERLPGACVVTLGAPERGTARQYITLDLSHPEIVL